MQYRHRTPAYGPFGGILGVRNRVLNHVTIRNGSVIDLMGHPQLIKLLVRYRAARREGIIPICPPGETVCIAS